MDYSDDGGHAEDTQLYLITFDISSRSVLERTAVTEGPSSDYSEEEFEETVGFSCSSNSWCLFCFWAFGWAIDDFAYNIETGEMKSFMNRSSGEEGWDVNDDDDLSFDDPIMRSMTQSSDCSTAFYAIREEEEYDSLVVLGLGDDGHLSERFSFPVEEGMYIVAATQLRVFLQHGSSIKEYNAETGECCRRLGPFTQDRERRSRVGNGIDYAARSDDDRLHGVISKRRQELYVPEDGITVKAFCLEEPSIF